MGEELGEMGMEIVSLVGERGRGEEREDWTRIWSRKTMDDVEVFERREGIERGETKDGNSRLGIEGMDWGLRI